MYRTINGYASILITAGSNGNLLDMKAEAVPECNLDLFGMEACRYQYKQQEECQLPHSVSLPVNEIVFKKIL